MKKGGNGMKAKHVFGSFASLNRHEAHDAHEECLGVDKKTHKVIQHSDNFQR